MIAILAMIPPGLSSGFRVARVHPRDTLEISKQAALNPKLGRSSPLEGNIKMTSWIIGTDLILYVQDVLQLQESHQTHIEPDGVGPDVDP
jgi:hypothetical protein